jgi:hypothetical protein
MLPSNLTTSIGRRGQTTFWPLIPRGKDRWECAEFFLRVKAMASGLPSLGAWPCLPITVDKVHLSHLAVPANATGGDVQNGFSRPTVGIGRILCQAAHGRLAERGFDVVQIHAQEDKQEFYEKLGYQLVSADVFLEDGAPHVAMHCVLSRHARA